jgi:hypothetical protein
MVVLALTWTGLACWVVCFWWMHRISSRQDTLLTELHEIAKRIENVSKAEHELIQEVHPKVSDIKEKMENVAEAISSNDPKTKSSK